MDICFQHESEIAYDGSYCPACAEIEVINLELVVLRNGINDFELRETGLVDKITNAEKHIHALEEELRVPLVSAIERMLR